VEDPLHRRQRARQVQLQQWQQGPQGAQRTQDRHRRSEKDAAASGGPKDHRHSLRRARGQT
jgi:hypothetical protein